METDWYCPECKWWVTEAGLKDEEYLSVVVVNSCGINCPKCWARLKSRPSEFENYSRKVCDKARKSYAMSVRPEDVPNAMKKWPGSRYDKNGVLEISGRAEKKIRMKQRGFCEH